ncbi:MAG: hypothetical protein M3Z09_05145 [Acidobacteriota bacterium]|nr:hypothetical protein [Acidobacteriota bacterium]
MTHLTEEQLIECYYGQTEPHLETCAACRNEYREICLVLTAMNELPVPEPPPYAWKQKRRWHAWLLAPVFAAGLIAAFFTGRVSTKPVVPPVQEGGRERVLLVALGAHLERSQMVLLELANADGKDFEQSRLRARALIGDNRLFRQTTSFAGDRGYTELLDELDRLLTGVANTQSQLSSPASEQIERLLFKIRVTDSNLQWKGAEKL